MKLLSTFLAIVSVFFVSLSSSLAQESWPITITGSNGTIVKLYQWQPESFSNNELKARAAVSVLENGKTEPVFGVAWLNARTRTDGNQVRVETVDFNSIKLPGDIDDDKLESIRSILESKTDGWQIVIPLTQLQADLDLNKQQTELSNQISNTPPKIIYNSTPSILVLIDGTPKVQYNDKWEIDAVVNTPFTIVKNQDGNFYLYGGKHWYTAPAATGPYTLTTAISSRLQKIENTVNDASKNDVEGKESDENTIYKIIVSTEPAELIQSKGEANFSAVQGSGLLYVSNSENDIFMDVNTQDYYVLISGRWYKSKTLSGKWQYISPGSLPADFARIPEGSPKDNVLASIAGTEAAQDALEEAEVPQTARVDRHSAKAEVMYDGNPEFEVIDGTDLAYATNTSASVIRWRGRYYSVDNGVWFEAGAALGPWVVSVSRPYAVALIPPRYPVYHMKYVYIYDVTPDYVWMGYTPGYLNTFIYGPTIVYGTGYHYRPWYGRYYFPRPFTWGFSVTYNPWFGWGLGFGFSNGWFNSGFYSGRSTWGGGWWGPRSYRPAYCWSPNRYSGGYYGRNAVVYNRSSNRNYNGINRNYSSTNNIYRDRGGIVSRTNTRNYSPERSRNNRGNISYNNGDRDRNNNFPGSRADQRITRPSREYSPGRDNNRYNNGTEGNLPGRSNTGPVRGNNNREARPVNPDPSRRPDLIPGNNTPRSNNTREVFPQQRTEIENGGGSRREPVARPRQLQNSNNPGQQYGTTPGRSGQSPRRELLNTPGSGPDRTIRDQQQIRPERTTREQPMQVRPERTMREQPQQIRTERRESVAPASEQRGGGNNVVRPSRGANGGGRSGDGGSREERRGN